MICFNLQAQAQAIYEDMFSAHASDAWAQGTLSDIAEIIMGQKRRCQLEIYTT